MAQRIKDEEIKLKISVDASSGTKELKNNIAFLAPNTEEFKKLNKEFLLVNARLKELRSGSVKTSGIFGRLRTGEC